MLRKIISVWAVVVAVITFAQIAVAQSAGLVLSDLSVNPSAPLETSADTLSMNQKNGTVVFEGNVVILQDTMRLQANRVELWRAESDDLERMLATGNVLLVTATEEAEAQKADYDITNGVIDMSGDVMISQAKNAFLADDMTIDLNAGTAALDGNVRTILNAGTKP